MKYVFRKKRNILLASILDFFGGLIFSLGCKRGSGSSNPQNLLLIRLDHLGDALLASGAAGVIKKRFPSCRITFLCSSASESMLRHHPAIDEIRVFDAAWFSRAARRGGSLADLAQVIREGRYDTAIAFRGDLRENIAIWAAKIPVRIGYGITGGGFFLNRLVDHDAACHEIESDQKLIEVLTGAPVSWEPEIHFSATERSRIGELLQTYKLGDREAYVGVQLDAGSTSKEWPRGHVEKFLQTASNKFLAGPIVLFGLRSPRWDWVDSYLRTFDSGCRIVDLRGKTTLRDTLLLISQARAFLGPDSGPTHAAGAMGVPTVFLYSGTNVMKRWAPRGLRAKVLKRDVPCQPCARTVCPIADHPCMAEIRPEEVWKALEGVLHG